MILPLLIPNCAAQCVLCSRYAPEILLFRCRNLFLSLFQTIESVDIIVATCKVWVNHEYFNQNHQSVIDNITVKINNVKKLNLIM